MEGSKTIPDLIDRGIRYIQSTNSCIVLKKQSFMYYEHLIVMSMLAAVFASLTSILAKIGITDVESNLGTAICTGVVLLMAWGIVFTKGKQIQVKSVDRKELIFICLPGLATGA